MRFIRVVGELTSALRWVLVGVSGCRWEVMGLTYCDDLLGGCTMDGDGGLRRWMIDEGRTFSED